VDQFRILVRENCLVIYSSILRTRWGRRIKGLFYEVVELSDYLSMDLEIQHVFFKILHHEWMGEDS